MRNRFFLLLGLFPGSLVPAVAQTPTPWNVLAQEHVAPNSTMISTVSTPLPAASFLLAKGEKSNARFSLMFAGAYKRDHSLEHLSPMNEVKTLSLTWSSLPLVQSLWPKPWLSLWAERADGRSGPVMAAAAPDSWHRS